MAKLYPASNKEDFVASTENALHYFGGVPAAIVPDNLKSAVTKSNRYEPTINKTFVDFAEHYETTILPARAYKPRDKSLAEGAVKILYQRIYSVQRKQVFHSLKEMNKVILEELEKHNNKKLTGHPQSIREMFNDLEKEALSPLPVDRYEIKQLAFATVMQNGHVPLSKDKHYYSVPYNYIRKKVKIMYTNQKVEIYYKYNRITLHKRDLQPYNYTTVKEHLATMHQFITEWTPQRFINWAGSIDEDVKTYITNLLERKQHPEQAYKSCMGVLSYTKKVGPERLIKACRRVIEFDTDDQKALEYYDMLTSELRKERNLSQGVPKAVAGGETNTEVIPEYQLG